MKIVYRMSPFKPDNPSIFLPDDKYGLVHMCHNSFLKAGGDQYEKLYILDSCEGWTKDFKKHGEVMNISNKNKFASLFEAFHWARHQEGKILFVEDDYLWRPNTIPLIDLALNELPVVSPYDHPGHYTEEKFDHQFEIRLVGSLTYRTCPSNTHTFATKAKIIDDNWSVLVDRRNRPYHDHPAFMELNKRAQMWCPLYSFATHLATGCLAPNVNWNEFTE